MSQAVFIAHPKIKLLDQAREVIRFKHLSIRTEEASVHWIRQFIFFHRQVREESLDFRRAHFLGMPLLVEENDLSDPMDRGLLGSNG